MIAPKGLKLLSMTDGLRYPTLPAGILIIVGGFGSGKTEISVNLTRYLALSGERHIAIADLDLVNPYFRSREAREEMERLGVRLIAPKGGNFYADLPILLPEIKGAVEERSGRLILDVGGDAQGSRALGSLSDIFTPGAYQMLMVLNSRRPFTADVAGTIETMRRIELSSKLRFTGLIANSHMIDETTPEIILEGLSLARQVERVTGLPLQFLCAKEDILAKIPPSDIDCAVLPLTRLMLKPWERKSGSPKGT
ncbi:MAG: cobalamin biosynthesis protein CbiA [bacterium]|jgi:hypothetical protein